MFIIDFDDTLFDTYAFKHARFAALAEIGVSEDQYKESYKKARNSNDGFFTYSNERHADELSTLGYERAVMLDALEKTTGEALQSYVMPGAIDLLKALQEKQQPMILLSLGDPSFQELKVEGSGIHQYFDRKYMVEETKDQVFATLLAENEERDTWFINDKIDETLQAKKHFPNIHVALKKSPLFDKDEYTKSEIPYFETLNEIQTYVEHTSK